VYGVILDLKQNILAGGRPLLGLSGLCVVETCLFLVDLSLDSAENFGLR